MSSGGKYIPPHDRKHGDGTQTHWRAIGPRGPVSDSSVSESYGYLSPRSLPRALSDGSTAEEFSSALPEVSDEQARANAQFVEAIIIASDDLNDLIDKYTSRDGNGVVADPFGQDQRGHSAIRVAAYNLKRIGILKGLYNGKAY